MEAVFSSPREEALEYALKARKSILEGKINVTAILRSCLVISRILNRNEDEKWILKELEGYHVGESVPDYRKISCYFELDGVPKNETKNFDVSLEVSLLDAYREGKDPIRYMIDKRHTVIIRPILIERIMAPLINRCLLFLNDIVKELQYGGVIEYLMENIRKNTDEKLIKLGEKVSNEANSLYMNLVSTNPSDWPKVADSSRRLLQIISDLLFPSQENKYKMKDEREIEVGEQQFINRLCAFIDQKISGKERKFLMTEINYLESYLREIVEFIQMGVHNKEMEKYNAEMIAIHTYLIISDILKFYQ